ncbi:hypothetical protein MXB_3469, partial [Myxobolus squamalis]
MNPISGGSPPNYQKQNKILLEEIEKNMDFKFKTPKTKNKKHDLQFSPVRRSQRLKNRLIYAHFDLEKSSHISKRIRKKKYEQVSSKGLGLTSDIFIHVLKQCEAKTIINFGMTSRKNNVISRVESVWKQRCYRDFNLIERWYYGKYLKIYKHFYNAFILSKWTDLFRPSSRLRISFVSWFLTQKKPPHKAVAILSPKQVHTLWGIPYRDIIKHMSVKFGIASRELLYVQPFSWKSAYELAFLKFGSVSEMQQFILQRCYRSIDVINQLIQYFNVGIHFSIKQIIKRRKNIKTAIDMETLMTWAQTYTERYMKIIVWQHKNEIQTIHHRYRYDNYRCQTLLSSYLETGDSIVFDELINYHLRLKRLILYVTKNNAPNECWNIFTFKSRGGSQKRRAKQAALKYVNSGLEEDYTRFFLVYNRILSSDTNYMLESYKSDENTNSSHFSNF